MGNNIQTYKSRGFFITWLLFAHIACAVSSFAITADDIIPISADREKRMGDSIARQVEKKFEEVDDPLVQKRFEDIGKRLAPVCERQEFIYRFKVLKADENEEKEKFFNAFALPGGYVYIFDAMMEVLKTDENIAGVTAHELAHISARHSVERLQSSLGVNALMLLAIVTSGSGRTVAEANMALASLMSAYSREAEIEADKLSVKYLKSAGFDPDGALGSLMMLQKLRKDGPERKYIYFKSHPYLSERISAVRTEMQGYADFDSYINTPKDENGFY
ncbi:MAG: M48 family metalloprotease [Candidatus Omnitrophota bacterium]